MTLWSVFDVTALPRTIWQKRDLLVQMSMREVLQRYRGSFLGLVWSVAHPLLMLSVYTFVFTVIFPARWGTNAAANAGHGAFAVIMFCGMTIFNLFSEAVNGSCGCIVANPNLVKKVIFPLEILPLAKSLATLILGLAWFVLLFLGAFIFMGGVPLTALLLPVLLVPFALFTLGVAYFVASFGVYIRDTQYLIGVILQILFFATPIFYSLEVVPERFRVLLQLNPLVVFIEQSRALLFAGALPSLRAFALASLISLVVFQLGYVFFMKTKKGFADVL